MKEMPPQVKNSLRDAGHSTVRYARRQGIPLATGIIGTAALVNKDWFVATYFLGMAGVASVCESRYEDRQDKLNELRAYRQGLMENPQIDLHGTIFDLLNNHGIEVSEVRPIEIPFIERTPDEEPLYKSLDGKQSIYSTPDLVESLGDNPHSISVRIMTALRHTEKRGATVSDVELFRRADALLDIAPDIEAVLCEDGGETIEKMRQVIGSYEASHGFDKDNK